MASVLTNAITLPKQPRIAASYGRWLASRTPAVDGNAEIRPGADVD